MSKKEELQTSRGEKSYPSGAFDLWYPTYDAREAQSEHRAHPSNPNRRGMEVARKRKIEEDRGRNTPRFEVFLEQETGSVQTNCWKIVVQRILSSGMWYLSCGARNSFVFLVRACCHRYSTKSTSKSLELVHFSLFGRSCLGAPPCM